MGFLDAISALFVAPRPLSPEAGDAIELAAQLVGPMLRTASGYPQRLGECAMQGLAYCHELADAIPGPLDINHHAFAADPVVHALFGSAASIREMLGRSHVVREFLDTHAVAEHF